MKTLNALLLILLICIPISLGAQCGLQAGPMPGFSDYVEVTVWVQTKCAQEVQMQYWRTGHPDTTWWSSPVHTVKEHGYCAHLIADAVAPGNTYDYKIYIDSVIVETSYPLQFQSQTLWQSRTEPPDFTFVAGSCTFVNDPEFDRPGKPYGGDYGIFTTILQDNPDLMIWLGDNMYLREVDWNSKTGIYHRYTHTRSLPELQPLLGSVHHYAVWDDHDYGPNDSDRSYWGKEMTLQAFKDFWANPNYGVGGTEGITGSFTWNDCQFFLMDDRWYRAPQDPEADYFGDRQVQWLIDALRYSRANYKFICTGGQVISNAKVFENYAVFAHERQALLDSIDKYNIKGVVFLTGDRHHSEISKMTTADGDILYDITSSALTSSTSPHPDEANQNRVPGSMIGVRNYALISVTGPRSARKCKVIYKDAGGAVLFEWEL